MGWGLLQYDTDRIKMIFILSFDFVPGISNMAILCTAFHTTTGQL